MTLPSDNSRKSSVQGKFIMSQVISFNRTAAGAAESRRWWVLGILVAAQFMYVMDAFIVNVALPTMARDLNASASQIEAIVAVYFTAYATLIITGGRLGDIHGAKRIFVLGIAGFTLASLWCGLAQSGTELIVARLAQGATAALMVPQVLATIHVLFSDEARPKAFAIYGIVLGLGGAAGFLFGGVLVTLDLLGLGWRSVFFVNVPFGVIIAVTAALMIPRVPRREGVRLDVLGAAVLFVGLACLIGPLLFGRDLHWALSVWAIMAVGAAIVIGFIALERTIAAKGGLPLIELGLLADRALTHGLAATFLFFFANLSFYLVMTLFMQSGLGISPVDAGLALMPLALGFVVSSRQSAARIVARGIRTLIEGCVLQLVGLADVVALVAFVPQPTVLLLMLPLAVFGYGQGFVMGPLSGVVLSTVPKTSAGSGSGLYGTVTQIANAVGIAVVGAVFFAFRDAGSEPVALLAALATITVALIGCCGCLVMRIRAT
jgi:EmrB/QacA subfamily drug resistance transporter